MDQHWCATSRMLAVARYKRSRSAPVLVICGVAQMSFDGPRDVNPGGWEGTDPWKYVRGSEYVLTPEMSQSFIQTCRWCSSAMKDASWRCAGGRHNMSRPLQVDLWPFDLEIGVRVTCDVGYLCANFSVPRPLCSRLRPDVRDRQTSDAHHRLMPHTLGAGAY